MSRYDPVQRLFAGLFSQKAMKQVILFGVGSPILVDIEETLHRSGWSIAAGIRNRPAISYLSAGVRLMEPEHITAEMTPLCFLVPLFTPANRRQAALEAASVGLHQPGTLVDPSVTRPRRLELGPGIFINAGCTLGAGSTFDRFVFINRAASVGHHARVGAFVSIGPGVTIAGGVTIGAAATIGAGATILPDICIGENAVIGAGAVVTRDVPDGSLAIGNPARIMRPVAERYQRLNVA